ncbi:hypothetical protein HCN44_000938 [Aphidius gifuensis]|uniref:Uncharacterized protein n=1 Tax=Aphidius gifuensis TaxID=684658 RepID=A0A834XK22_APHGI|nr:hypothetical protein HCN44_000938 [Aphidius gifuensis]
MVCCQADTLEGLYNNGTKIISTIALQQKNNITSRLKNAINDIVNDLFYDNYKYFSNYPVPTKLRAIKEIKIMALNCIECGSTVQSNHEDYIEPLITGVKAYGKSFQLCFIKNNSTKAIMKCLDDFVKNENKSFNKYQQAINKVSSHNSVMISKIKNCDDNCTFSTNQVSIILKKKNHENTQQQGAETPSILPSFLSTKQKSTHNCPIKSITRTNFPDEKLKNLFVNHKKALDNVDLKILEAIYFVTTNATFKNISQTERTLNYTCCFGKFYSEVGRLRMKSINEHGGYFYGKMMEFENFVSKILQDDSVRKVFKICFDNFASHVMIFKCMGSAEFDNSSSAKYFYDAFVCEFEENMRIISVEIHDYSYNLLRDLTQSVINLNNQLFHCIENGKNSNTCPLISFDDFKSKKSSQNDSKVLKIVQDIDSSFTDTSD